MPPQPIAESTARFVGKQVIGGEIHSSARTNEMIP
jgi:hypothetical protein